MIYISHRGNLNGIDRSIENKPEQIELVLSKGFDCEIDVWNINGNWFLGHDGPEYSVGEDFLFTDGLWLHCKNKEALSSLIGSSAHYFWHQEDDYTLTSHGYAWVYPGKDPIIRSICCLPEWNNTDISNFIGVCSDYVEDYRDKASTI